MEKWRRRRRRKEKRNTRCTTPSPLSSLLSPSPFHSFPFLSFPSCLPASPPPPPHPHTPPPNPHPRIRRRERTGHESDIPTSGPRGRTVAPFSGLYGKKMVSTSSRPLPRPSVALCPPPRTPRRSHSIPGVAATRTRTQIRTYVYTHAYITWVDILKSRTSIHSQTQPFPFTHVHMCMHTQLHTYTYHAHTRAHAYTHTSPDRK